MAEYRQASRMMYFLIFVALIVCGVCGSDNACTSQNGICQVNSNLCPYGSYHRGLCSGAVNRQCCISPDHACTSENGQCQDNSNPCPGGSYHTGKCGGGTNRQCCISPDHACTSENGQCQDNSNPCPGGSYHTGKCGGGTNRQCCISPDHACTSENGQCQDNSNACPGGSYHTGKCGGGTNRQCCIISSSGNTCSNVNIISRAAWGASAPTSKSNVNNPLGMFFIHHTVSPECTDVSSCSSRVKNIQNYHMNNKGWSDIGYSFLVGGDGNIYEGRGWDVIGAHTAGYNSKGYAASFIGDFTSSLPNAAALQAAKNLIACGVKLGKLSSHYKLYGHRQAGTTSCPGNALYADIQKWQHWTAGHP